MSNIEKKLERVAVKSHVTAPNWNMFAGPSQ